ncbi:unnamed protein product, partial [Phaeothamnion confervicola]
YIEYDVDSERRVTRLFWSYAEQQADGARFTDVIIQDNTFGTNRYGLPLCVFIGEDSNFKTIVLAQALVHKEDTAAFTWAYEHFRDSCCVKGAPPVMFLTDNNKAAASAIKAVVSDSEHFLCMWHMWRNIEKH